MTVGGREEGVGALSADVLMFLDFGFDLLKLVCPDSPVCLHFFFFFLSFISFCLFLYIHRQCCTKLLPGNIWFGLFICFVLRWIVIKLCEKLEN